MFALAVLFGGTRPSLPGAALVLLGGTIVAGLGNLLQLRGLMMPLTAMAVGWLVWSEAPGISATIGATLFAINLPKRPS